MGSRVEAGGLEFVTHLFDEGPQRGGVAVESHQPVHGKDAEADRLHVKGRDRTAQGFGFFDELVVVRAGGVGFERRQQLIENGKRRGSAFGHARDYRDLHARLTSVVSKRSV